MILLSYQNCSNSQYQNPETSENGYSVICSPTDACLKFSLSLSASNDEVTSLACISTHDDENGPASDLSFAGSCSQYNNTCASCNLNENHSVTFSVTKENSKIEVEQTITVYFTPKGGDLNVGN